MYARHYEHPIRGDCRRALLARGLHERSATDSHGCSLPHTFARTYCHLGADCHAAADSDPHSFCHSCSHLAGNSGGPVSLSVSADQIGAHLDALQQIANANGGIRADATPGYDASVAYVASQLQAMGYEVQQQPFDFTFFDEAAPVTLSAGSSSWTGPEWMHAMLYSPPGDVSGPVHAISIGADGYAKGTAGCDACRLGRLSPRRNRTDRVRAVPKIASDGPCTGGRGRRSYRSVPGLGRKRDAPADPAGVRP